MLRRPPRSTRTDTLFPYTTLFRSFLDPQLLVLGRTLRRGIDRRATADFRLEPGDLHAQRVDRRLIGAEIGAEQRLVHPHQRLALRHHVAALDQDLADDAAFEIGDDLEPRTRDDAALRMHRPIELDRKSTRLNSSHYCASRMPSS